MGVLIEHCGGAFPLWLAPIQVKVLTLTERQRVYGRVVEERLSTAGFRVELDDRNEKLGYKIREGQLAKVPYMLIVGDKEAAQGTVAPRRRGSGAGAAVDLDAFVEQLGREVRLRGSQSDRSGAEGKNAKTEN